MTRASKRDLERGKKLLSDPDRTERSSGIWMLERVGSREAFELLIEVPDSEDVPALSQALIACSKNVDDVTRFLDRIEIWLGGRGIHRDLAFDCLEALGPRALRLESKLAKTFKAKRKGTSKDDKWLAIRSAVALYAVTGDTSYRDYMVECLADRSDVRVRTCAELGFQRLGEAERPVLENLLTKGNQLQRKAARAVLNWIERPIGRPGEKKVPMKRAKKSAQAKKRR